MQRLIAWLPRWVTYIAGALATGLLVVVPMMARLLSGPALVVCAVVGFLLGVVGFGGSALKQHQERHDARLNLELSVRSQPDPLPSMHVLPAIDAWCAEERNVCLASIDKWREESAPDVYREADVDDIPLAELERIEEKAKKGHELTADEARTRVVANRHLRLTLPLLLHGLGGGESRTVDQYRREVESHVRDCNNVLALGVIRQYVQQGMGTFDIALSTAKEKTYEKVQVVLRVEGRLRLRAVDQPPARHRLPERPVPYGKLSWLHTSLPSDMIRPVIPPQSFPVEHKERVEIERETEVTTVTYPSVTVRPGRAVRLPAIAVMASAEPGTNFRVEWSATSTSAEGHIKGEFELRIGDIQVPVDDLLIAALHEARG
ncbi:hypothetical protein [Micromonospora sp. WMMD736]|uniref:hypothetical protein n=1 Tax=Micromonospora sp. WMMD736 TaxID=3404112 RepID=UPI003B9230C2